MESLTKENLELGKKIMKNWKEQRKFNTKIEDKPKYLITFPFPYVNGAPHVGHAYSILRVDSYAKFKRLQGYNVLFPLGFHATGEPIVGVIERLKKNDQNQIDTLKLFGATDSDIASFVQDPKNLVLFWVNRWKSDVETAGCSIDWERTFITAGFSKGFNKFVEWQYNKLYEKGYIKQGTHPVIWCPHDNSPTGDHDRLIGEGESPQEYQIILFNSGNLNFACATLRPETVFRVTNLWIGEGEYTIAKVDGKEWILSESAVEKLKDQLHALDVIKKISSKELAQMKVKHPLTGKEMPIFETIFVDMNHATGVVMSVPSHAPYDYTALNDLVKAGNENAKEAMNNVTNMIELKEVPQGKLNAQFYCEKHKVNNLEDEKALENATSDLYKIEFNKGRFTIQELEGLNAEQAKKKSTELLNEKNASSTIYEMTGKVVCRCTTTCHVKILENQWFIDYKNQEWKEKSKAHLETMQIEPEIARTQFQNTIDWLEFKACARKSGFGTKLPFDNEWIVETLSDSTIYNAYYTISRFVNEGKIEEQELTAEVLDYIFLDGNKPSSKNSEIIEEMKKEFSYFYPVDMRGSGKDLIQNHLTFFLMQHVALFDNKYWPKGISVNGYVNVEGEKMSKSKGNVIPLKELMEQYGPDFVRMGMVASTEGMDDANWSASSISGYETRLNNIISLIENNNDKSTEFDLGSLTIQEKILLHIIEESKRKAKENYELLKFRSAAFESFFTIANAIKTYSKYGISDKVINFAAKEFFLINSPLLPYISEEYYNKITGKSITDETWPEDNNYNFKGIENAISLFENLKEDINAVIALVERKGGKATSVKIAHGEEWTYKMLQNKDKSLSELMQDEKIREKGQLASKLYPKLKKIEWNLDRDSEREIIEELIPLLEKEIELKIKLTEDNSVKQGIPGKPGIIIEEQ